MASEVTKMAVRGNIDMDKRKIQVTELVSEFKSDLQGRLEGSMDSEAMKKAVRFKMHINLRVIEVKEFKSEVKFYLCGHYYCRPLVFRAIALLFLYWVAGSLHLQLRVFTQSRTQKSSLLSNKCQQCQMCFT